MSNYSKIFFCEVCSSKEVISVLDLGEHPLCDDLVPVDKISKCNKFPIEIVYCAKCNTAHQKYQVNKKELFPKNYHYRARFTNDVLSGMDDLVNSIENEFGNLNNSTVLDIGCNDGSLLDKFYIKGAKTIGVEPTDAFLDAQGREHLIINDFFSELVAKKIKKKIKKIDFITFTNVFAHIENLEILLKSLLILIDEKTVVIIENHYLGAILEKKQFDTFYHEHPRTYSLNSFIFIAKKIKMKINYVEFPKRYGGNIRVFLSKKANLKSNNANLIKQTLRYEKKFLSQFDEIRSFIHLWKASKRNEIMNLIKKNGKLVAKAFPGRAAILINLLELSGEHIEAVYEKMGSPKIGHFLPGTNIQIKADNDLFFRLDKINVILNLAWHIPSEIDFYLRNNGYKGKIISIL